MTTLPGELYSPVAGPLLVRCCPVIEKGTGERSVVVWADDKLNEKGHYAVMTYSVGLNDSGDCATKCAALQFELDLEDPTGAGRDRAARWLQKHYGFEPGATAPAWGRLPQGSGYNGVDGEWSAGYRWYLDQDPVPWVSYTIDPIEALQKACLHAAGRA